MGTTKGTVHFCPVSSRYGAISLLSRRLCEREVKPAQSCFLALFRPIFQSGRFVAINKVKRAGRNKVLMMIDLPDVWHISDDVSLLSDASICLQIPSFPANFPLLPFPVPVSLSDSGQKWRRLSAAPAEIRR